MALYDVIGSVRIWIFLGVILAFVIGPIGDFTSTLLIVVLIAQMSLAMDGLTFTGKSLSENRKGIMISVAACFILCTGTALFMGLFFIGDKSIWTGWVMLAAVPCAVSVITAALYLNGDRTLSVLATAVIYIAALALTPLISFVFAGDAVSPLEILKYVILFIAIPLGMTFPLKKLHLNKKVKVVSINVLMMIMVILSVGFNRAYFFSEPMMVLFIAIACVFRTFIVSIAMVHIMRRRGTDRGKAFVYMPMGIWKNSGLASTLCIVLMPGVPEAVLPCIVSLLVETVWFAVMEKPFAKWWPAVSQS